MTTTTEIITELKKVAGKWYNPQTGYILRKMKNVDKLIEYADKVSEICVRPNNFDGRGGYLGRFEYREFREDIHTRTGIVERITEFYYPAVVDPYTGKDGIRTGNGVISKNGNYWYFNLQTKYTEVI